MRDADGGQHQDLPVRLEDAQAQVFVLVIEKEQGIEKPIRATFAMWISITAAQA